MCISIEDADLGMTVAVHIPCDQIHQEHLFSRRFVRGNLFEFGIGVAGVQHGKLHPAIQNQVGSPVTVQVTDHRRLEWEATEIERLPGLEAPCDVLENPQFGSAGVDHDQFVPRLAIQIEDCGARDLGGAVVRVELFNDLPATLLVETNTAHKVPLRDQQRRFCQPSRGHSTGPHIAQRNSAGCGRSR